MIDERLDQSVTIDESSDEFQGRSRHAFFVMSTLDLPVRRARIPTMIRDALLRDSARFREGKR
jgi:hypothetical protein